MLAIADDRRAPYIISQLVYYNYQYIFCSPLMNNSYSFHSEKMSKLEEERYKSMHMNTSLNVHEH